MHPEGGSAFIYEGTGFESGTVVWRDTTSMEYGPDDTIFGIIDYNSSVIVNIGIWDGMPVTYLTIISFSGSEPISWWESPIVEGLDYFNPYIYDMDIDGKIDLAFAAVTYGINPKLTHVWEQTSASVTCIPDELYPSSIELHSNIPNPFNNTTIIPYTINKSTDISIKIYNLTGKEVYYHNQYIQPGEYFHSWDASGLSSGIYFISLESSGNKKVRKVVLMK